MASPYGEVTYFTKITLIYVFVDSYYNLVHINTISFLNGYS